VRDNVLWLRDQAATTPAVKVTRDELVARVREKQATREQPVVIAADKNARYEDVLSVLDLLQRNGVKKVGLLARPPAT
jgi:biopolymer transport protein TolR